jgi:hypothetical protein
VVVLFVQVNFKEFYTNPRVKDGFKDYVRYLLERTNTVTGVQYKVSGSRGVPVSRGQSHPYVLGLTAAKSSCHGRC